jgi:hypothetical protein
MPSHVWELEVVTNAYLNVWYLYNMIQGVNLDSVSGLRFNLDTICNYVRVPAGVLTLKIFWYIQSLFQHSTFLENFKSSSEMCLKTLDKTYG